MGESEIQKYLGFFEFIEHKMAKIELKLKSDSAIRSPSQIFAELKLIL